MRTILTASRRLPPANPATRNKILSYVKSPTWHTIEVNRSFPDSTMRPKEWLKNMLIMGNVDKVVQIGYDGIKTELVTEAELCEIDVFLFTEY